MPLVITDETLRAANLTEHQARVEIACRLFDAGKLALWPAASMAGLNRDEFLSELKSRGISGFRPQMSDIWEDMETIDRILDKRSNQ